MLLKDKVALITGAARGLGEAVAYGFAREGAKAIVIADIDIKKAGNVSNKIIEMYGCESIAIRVDVSNEKKVIDLFVLVMEKFGTIDIVVNNAGICRMVDLNELSMDEWDRTMNVNLKGTFLFCREALKIMKKNRQGKIINVASQAGKIGGLMVGPDYPASKAGVLCLTKTFAKKAAPYNVNVNSVAPGLIATELTKDFGYEDQMIPLGRIGTVDDVAGAIIFLASGMSDYITGACIDINGGMTMW